MSAVHRHHFTLRLDLYSTMTSFPEDESTYEFVESVGIDLFGSFMIEILLRSF